MHSRGEIFKFPSPTLKTKCNLRINKKLKTLQNQTFSNLHYKVQFLTKFNVILVFLRNFEAISSYFFSQKQLIKILPDVTSI